MTTADSTSYPTFRGTEGIGKPVGQSGLQKDIATVTSATGAAPDEEVRRAQSRQVGRTAIWICIVAAIVFGAAVRISNISGKVFWSDEVVTQIAISGRKLAIDNNRFLTKDQVTKCAEIDK